MDYVFVIGGIDYGKLKDVLAAEPFADDSFAKAGYTLRESKPLGLKGGDYILHFRTADDSLASRLKARLKPLESAKELEGNAKDDISAKISADEDSATQGFGSIFG
ncbi:MAG: hypothetical protein V1787_05545 [Candidatus Micrarchaeota archaeon]